MRLGVAGLFFHKLLQEKGDATLPEVSINQMAWLPWTKESTVLNEDTVVKPFINNRKKPPSGSTIDVGDIVQTTEGPIKGLLQNSVRSFLGVPYAGSASAQNRFKPPTPASKRTGLFDARNHGPACMQVDLNEPSMVRDMFVGLPSGESEDCLSVNIHTPSKDRIQNALPVVFFIHGGCFSAGSASCTMYNPADMVDAFDVIFVLPNYRLNVFGFLASEDLKSESANGSFGNYAIQDVITALRWTRQNIKAFGGDPDQITLMGQSAGAIMVSYLQVILAGPLFQNEPKLYQRAILSSGSMMTLPVRQLSDSRSEPVYQKLIEKTGCADAQDRLQCLRAVPARQITRVAIEESWYLTWQPIIDGVLLPDDPIKLIKQGQIIKTPVLITSCMHDASIFTVGERLQSIDDLRRFGNTAFGDSEKVELILRHYPLSRYGNDAYLTATAIVTDAFFKCPVMSYGAHVQPHVTSVHYMSFHHRLWLPDWLQRLGLIKDPGVFHGSELLTLFNPFHYVSLTFSQEIKTLRQRIVKFIVADTPILSTDENNDEPLNELPDIDYDPDAVDQICTIGQPQSEACTRLLKSSSNGLDSYLPPDPRLPVHLKRPILMDLRCGFWKDWDHQFEIPRSFYSDYGFSVGTN